MPPAPSTFDAIVIGSGISGGWAAKELCDKGLKTLVLERGRSVAHIKDYPTMNLNPWELPHRGERPHSLLDPNPLISRSYFRIVSGSLTSSGRGEKNCR